MSLVAVVKAQQIDSPFERSIPATMASAFSPRKAFITFLVLYVFSLGGHYTSGDGFHKVQWARQIISGGPFWIDSSTGLPPKYGSGHSLVVIPGLVISGLLRTRGLHVEAAIYTAIFAANGALLLYLVAVYLRPYYEAKRIWITLCAIGLATFWWPYSKLDFTESLVTTTFFAAFLLLRGQRTFLGFACAGFMMLLRSDSALLILLLLVWHVGKFRNWRTLALAAAGVLPSATLFAVINFFRFGTVFDHGYANETFTNPLLVGLYGILLSPGKSVFLFSPPLVLGFLGWRIFRQHFREDAFLFLTVFIIQLFVYSKWWDWSGDDSWGVRFLCLSVVLMTIPMIELNNQKLVLGIVLLGIAIQVPAILVSGLDYAVVLHSGAVRRPRLGVDGNNTVDIEDMRFDPQFSQIAGNYALVLQRFGIHTRQLPHVQQMPSRDNTLSGQRSRCEWDFWWCR